MSVIEVNELTKYYGRARARGIVDVSFHVDEGEIFGFIGPNGAGKSTTIRLLLVVLNAAVIVISIAGSYLLYQRRNIHAAV